MTPTVQIVLQDILDHPAPPELRSCTCECAKWHPHQMGCEIAVENFGFCRSCAEIIDQTTAAHREAHPEQWAAPEIGG